jgi:VanZ family protein
MHRTDPMRRAARWAGGACVLALVWLSWIPRAWEIRTGLAGQIEHAVAYAGTALILSFAPVRPGRLFAALALLACVLEVGQIWVPGRTAQVIDALASIGGAALGVLAGTALREWLARRAA